MYCAETIKAQAKICRFCNRDQFAVPAPDSIAKVKATKPKPPEPQILLIENTSKLARAVDSHDFVTAVGLLTPSENQVYIAEVDRRKKSTGIAYLFMLLIVGIIGAHKFYLGQVVWGLLYLVCAVSMVGLPIVALGLFFDLFLLPGQVRSANDNMRLTVLRELLSRRR